MSVYKSKRSTSAIQYVENARQLQVFTIKNCVKFPKRYTFIVITILVQAAIALAVLHAFKVRRQKNITWTSPARKWYFVASAAAQAALAVISFVKTDDSSFWLLTIIVSALAAINLCTQLTIGKEK